MEDLEDYIEIPVIAERHEWFMYVISKFEVQMKIKGGNYLVYYTNPLDLYEIGLQVARQPIKDFVTSYGLPVKHNS